MLLYCPDCKRLYEETEKCPACGKRKGREPQAEDVCFLQSVNAIWVEMLSDMLTENGIPFQKVSSQGAALAMFTGLYNETFDFYVTFDRYEEAKELTDAFFAQNAEEEPEEEAETEEAETESEEE
ncbi:MAG: hypothetical protein IJS41_11630 [Clostridia bacterium]|nr:hypothetical protein [Clostridia bacterium]